LVHGEVDIEVCVILVKQEMIISICQKPSKAGALHSERASPSGGLNQIAKQFANRPLIVHDTDMTWKMSCGFDFEQFVAVFGCVILCAHDVQKMEALVLIDNLTLTADPVSR
jgi:hypothetical protein